MRAPATVSIAEKDFSCLACQDTPAVCIAQLGCVDLTISLGAAGDKNPRGSAGAVKLYSEVLTNGLAARSAFFYRQGADTNTAQITVTRDGGGLTQIQASPYLAVLEDVTGGTKVTIYTNQVGGSAVSTTTVTQDGEGKLTVLFESNDLGTWRKTYSAATVEDNRGGIALEEYDNNSNLLRKKVSAEWTNTVGASTYLVQADLTYGATQEPFSRVISTYQSIPDLINGGTLWRKIQEDRGSGATVRTSTWTYDAYGRVLVATDPFGNWTRSVYASANTNAYELARQITPWLGADASAPEDQGRVRAYTTTVTTNGFNQFNTLTTTDQITGQTRSINTTINVLFTNWAGYSYTTNIVEFGTNRLVTVTQYDGTANPYLTVNPDDSVLTNLVYDANWSAAPFTGRSVRVTETYRGSPDGQNGHRTKSVSDKIMGTPVQSQTWEVRAGNWFVTQDDRTLAYDPQWRVTTNATLTGTNTTSYSCCGVSQTVDPEGNETRYSYDDLKRQVTVTRAGITTSNVFDAADRVLATYRYPDGQPGQAALVSSNTYNTAGELTATTDALGHTTAYSNWVDATTGYVFRQTTSPDGSTRIEKSYRDGQLSQVTGTAVHGLQYNYSVVSTNGYGVLVTRETKLNADGSATQEWTETWTDGAGRTLKTIRSGNVTTSQSTYNTQGQLQSQTDADGITTLFAYNNAGEQIVSATDMDHSGAISAADRITSNATTIATDHGATVLRRETWQLNDNGTFTSVSTSDTTGDGLRTWQTSFSLTNSTLTAYTDRFHAERTVTTTAPDGSTTISLYREGRLLSTTRKDAAGTQLSAVNYQHDALGRVATNTDTRTTTTYAYNNADQQTAVTVAGAGVTAQTTQFQYDTMGRRTVTTLPDNAHTYVSYLLTGEPSTNWGDRTYPVAYTYDHAGRMKTMTTWQDYAGKTGAAVTTWNYDPNTGQLISKKYPLPVG